VLETQEVFAEVAQLPRVSETLTDCFSTWQEQGKDAYREIALEREVLVDETGNHQVNHAGEQNQVNNFYIAQAKALNNTGLRVMTRIFDPERPWSAKGKGGD
jgi:hypothetical protein